MSSDLALEISVILMLSLFLIGLFISGIIRSISNISYKGFIGPGHLGIVTRFSSGGDYNLDILTSDQLVDTLRKHWELFRSFEGPCVNAKDSTHLAEYRYITENNTVKTIGWITKDYVVYRGRKYIFEKRVYI